jgi:MarR family transcriptional regulator, organic hydroperoxide resistance regulator
MTKLAARSNYPLGSALDFLQCLWRLDRALERFSHSMEKRYGITAQQRFMLRCIGKYPGMTLGQLASLLHVDPGTASAGVRRLEDKQLVERRRDPRDRRRLQLGLTAHGRKLDTPAEYTVEHAVEQWLSAAPTAATSATKKHLTTLIELLESELSDLETNDATR